MTVAPGTLHVCVCVCERRGRERREKERREREREREKERVKCVCVCRCERSWLNKLFLPLNRKNGTFRLDTARLLKLPWDMPAIKGGSVYVQFY